MKNRKTTTSVCNVITGVSTRLRCDRFAAAAGLLLLATAVPAWAQPSEVTKVLASDAAADDRFGFSCSISGDTVIVGAQLDDHSELENAGSAYIYQRDWGGPDIWGERAILRPGDLFANDQFGSSVSISGDIAIVGAPRHNDPGPNTGSAYIFYRDQDGPDQWGFVTRITNGNTNSQFGTSVSIHGDLVIVGAPSYNGAQGQAHIFGRNAGGPDQWGQVAELTASNGQAGDLFGWSVSISGATAIVGAPFSSPNGSLAGSAYVFQEPPGGWANMTETARLHALDGDDHDLFGWSVSISGDPATAIVGALADDDNGSTSGSAYIFSEDEPGPVDGWGQVKKLTATDTMSFDLFGGSVTIRGERAIVGARGRNNATGAVYIFDRAQGGPDNWGQVGDPLTAPDGADDDLFGWSVLLDGDLAVIGATKDDDPVAGTDAGSAYVFEGVCPCPADLDGDGGVGVMDLLIFLGMWGPCVDCNDCPADFDGDCDVGVTDLLFLLGSWGPCPCNPGAEVLSLQEELDDACLTQDDWDKLVDVMQTGTEEEKENWLCWMNHYLDDCNRCICTHEVICPGPDPFG